MAASVVGYLTLIVCVLGLIAYLALTKFAKATLIDIARICFAFGLLAYLFAAGAQSCSMGTSTSSTTTQHR